MPSPVGIGAVVTVNHLEHRMTKEELSRLDDSVVNFCARLFAKLDTGDLVFGPPPGMGLGVPRTDLPAMDVAAFSAFVAENVAMRSAPHLAAGHAHVYLERWEHLAAELRRAGATVSAADLVELPFDTVLDAEARRVSRAAA